jgi:hypothetical protein
MGPLIDTFGQAATGFIGSPPVQLGLRLVFAYIVLLWLATAWWAFRDGGRRTSNLGVPYLAAGLVLIATPLLFPFAVIVYRIARPGETLAEAYERRLSEEALRAELGGATCPHCARRTEPEWLLCPTCGERLHRRCAACHGLVDLDWALCAWCGADFGSGDPRAARAASPVQAVRPLTPGRPVERSRPEQQSPGRVAGPAGLGLLDTGLSPMNAAGAEAAATAPSPLAASPAHGYVPGQLD